MFHVDRSKNSLARLERRRFADLDIREREHLQEWLVRMPDSLGEDLLIIQKEFDGFADTRERLDLLALDKEGRLVVIENKLDDSGRDVVWQALKYAAYCSTLTKGEIVQIYQSYLDRWSESGSAVSNLCGFLEVEELDDVVLNAGNEQRLMLIAANFRKEVTATVLWLLEHRVGVQCFQVVPHTFGEDIFIDIRQIIPTPEQADYMIGMAEKESEETSIQRTRTRSEKLRYEFWIQTLEQLAPLYSRFENVGPSKENYLNCGTGVSNCVYSLFFLKAEARVELRLERSDARENKWIFDQLQREKREIEDRFGAELIWQRQPERKTSRILYSHPFDGFNTENWPEIVNWLCQHIVKLDKALSKPLDRLNQELKSGGVRLEHSDGFARTGV